jgi:hypothetical protein
MAANDAIRQSSNLKVLMVSVVSVCALSLEVFQPPSIVIPLEVVFRYGGGGVC